VRSEVGHGSTFIFELSMPLAAPDLRLASATDRGSVIGYEGPRKRVLVADDVEHNRTMLIDSLGSLGFEVSEAASGQQALDSVRHQRPDLIIMDLSMPGMTGLEATYRIRLTPGLEHLPIIATSASATPEVEADSRATGASDFIAKPIDQQALQRAIWRHLALRSIAPSQQPSRSASHTESEDTIIPPREEMQVLLDLARAGNMRDIRQRADYLINLDPRYAPFSRRLRNLAENYASQAIVALVERHYAG
jgi:CheY-like chemotaxis protein